MRSVIRRPNIKKSISSRTTGRATRTVRKLTDPTYGRKGSGYIKNPKKALYNKAYSATSYGVKDIFNLGKLEHSGKSQNSRYFHYQETNDINTYYITNNNVSDFVREYPQVVGILRGYYVRRLLWGIFFLVLAFLFLYISLALIPSSALFNTSFIPIGISIYLFYKAHQYHYAYKDANEQLRKIDY